MARNFKTFRKRNVPQYIPQLPDIMSALESDTGFMGKLNSSLIDSTHKRRKRAKYLRKKGKKILLRNKLALS